METERITTIDNEDFLRQVSTEVDFTKDDVEYYIESLKEYCHNNIVFALAPVQIGMPKRIIYIRNTTPNMDNNENHDEEVIYINPTIINTQGHTRFLEGCASCIYMKDNQTIYYAGVIDRPYLLDVEYYDINGKKRYKTIEGFEATVFSHEYDHLDGVLHMDKATELFEMTLDEMREYRSKNAYEIISKD